MTLHDPCAWHITEAERLPYLAWHDRAHLANARGERQVRCPGCGLWVFSFERRETWARRPNRSRPEA